MEIHPMKPKSLVDIHDYNKDDILRILNNAAKFKANPNRDFLKGKVCATLFFEPSTRTRLSFETAINRLQGRVIGFSDTATSSLTKGESLKDTIMMVSNYADLIIMRHYLEGSARYASEISPVPIIMQVTVQSTSNTNVARFVFHLRNTGNVGKSYNHCVGDLKYGRAVHSLIEGLSYFNPTFNFVALKNLNPEKYKRFAIKRHSIQRIFGISPEAINSADILYMTRVQHTFYRSHEYEKAKTYMFCITIC